MRPGVDGRCGVHDVGRDREQVDRLLAQRAGLVEPGQQQQVLDEQARPGRLVLDAAQHLRQLVRVSGSALPEELGEPADRRERGAQLVARVRNEAPHAWLGRPGLDLRALLPQ